MSAEHNIELPDNNLHTDLAYEAHAMAVERTKSSIPGLHTSEEVKSGITTSWIWVESKEASLAIQKEQGTYLTIEVPALREKDSYVEKLVADHLTVQFEKFLKIAGIKDDDKALIIGLGNKNVTADALGPLVVEKSLITRHLFKLAPEAVAEGYRSVSSLSPGVMGMTGVETSEVVAGVVEKTKPDFVIAIDALASRALSRVNTTIQITDTGISPGSGVGNQRKALNESTLGVPVIAIGVPTVVDAATIAYDAVDYLLSHLSREIDGIKGNPLNPSGGPSLEELSKHEVSESTRSKMLGMFGGLSDEEKRSLIYEVLAPLGQNLIVTPKEVDTFIMGIANIVAQGINRALHDAVTAENISAHLN